MRCKPRAGYTGQAGAAADRDDPAEPAGIEPPPVGPRRSKVTELLVMQPTAVSAKSHTVRGFQRPVVAARLPGQNRAQ